MKGGILSVLLAIWMTSTMFMSLAVNVRADDRYINNQTQIALTPENYPGGIPADWYYPGDAITGTLIGQPIGGTPDGLEDTLDVVAADDDGAGGCDAFLLNDVLLQANNVVLDPLSGVGTFSFPGTATQYMSDGYYCAWVAPGDYIEGVSLNAYSGVRFQIHQYRIQASIERGGYIPGNFVNILYTVSRTKDGSPMTMTGYWSNWVVQSSDGLTYAYGNLLRSAGQFNFTIGNTGGVNPVVVYPATMWFNGTVSGAIRIAKWSQNVGVGNLACTISSPSSAEIYAPGAVLEVDVAVDTSTPTNYDYPGAVVLIKILDGGTLMSPEITAYTKTFVSDGAGNVRYAFVLDPAVILDGRTYTVSANATSILHYATDWTSFIVRTSLGTMAVRLTTDRTSYYSGESAVLTVASQPPPGHSQPSTFLYSVTSSGGGALARELNSRGTYTFHIPSNYQGTLTFRADVSNLEGDYGWDSVQRTVSFGVLIVNVDPSQYNPNDMLTVRFELKSTVMTGPTTSFYYMASDAARVVKQGPVNTGGVLQGSFQFTVPSAPATTYTFTIFASGGGHIVSGYMTATLIQGFMLSISLDKESYLPGDTMVVAYSIVPIDPAAPLPRLFLFVYRVIGLPFTDWQTSEASGVLDYAIPQDTTEGNAVFEVQESYTGAMALAVFLIGSPSGHTVPSAPQNLQATAGYHLVTLTWAGPSSDGGSAITGYRIYRGTSGGGETLLSSVGNTSSFTDSGLAAGQAYYYKVAAVNAVGEGAMSSESNATPSAPPSEGGAAETPANESMSLVFMVLAIIFLVIAAVLMFVNLRKMRQYSEGKQAAEMRKPEEQRK